ncbi:zinc-binding dehydrogenase [Defluviimonas sp. SAOS-178_SWC]|uniref:zinc-binding dehydrogenase n=1 Tax=Defluviimonas sp. SAOS-178_SWC TaxID=3121287 RepID=UPI003221F32D
MKAALYREYGPPEVLKYEEVDHIPPGPRDVLVKVRATSVNWFDIIGRKGEYRPNLRFPHIPGGDIAGEVAEIGSEVTNVKVGDPVVVYATVGCGQCESCRRGEPNVCLHYKYYGSALWGGYAQYCTVRADNLLPLYDGLDFAECAATNITFLTAWHKLARANIRPGEDILIQAVGSGIGLAALQIAKLTGLRVIGTAGSDEKCAKGLELGADYMINYKTHNFRDEVRRITDKRGVDVVFEHVGRDVWEDSVRSLTRFGRLVTCGASSGYDVTMNLAHVWHKQLSIIGSNHGTMNELATIVKLLEAGKLKPIIGMKLPLSEAAEAHRLAEARSVFGKIVLEPEH